MSELGLAYAGLTNVTDDELEVVQVGARDRGVEERKRSLVDVLASLQEVHELLAIGLGQEMVATRDFQARVVPDQVLLVYDAPALRYATSLPVRMSMETAG
jgi:hypothetical protein